MATEKNQLQNEREKRMWTQEEVAERVGSGASNVSRWERGETIPSLYYRRKLCELFEKSPQELFPDYNAKNDISAPSGPAHVRASSSLRAKPQRQSGSPGTVNGSFQLTTSFLFNMALQDAREFYGRAREKITLLSRTQKGESTSIVGPRKIGKTWLMKYLSFVASTQLGSHIRIGYLDAGIPSCATLVGFTTEALKGLGMPTAIEVDATEPLKGLEMGVKELQTQQQLPILCIDKFENFCKQREFHIGVLEQLRAIAAQGNLGLVIASKRPLVEIVTEIIGEHEQKTSLFFNIFRQVTLKPFTIQEAHAFVQAKGEEVHFTSDERDCVLQYARLGDGDEWLPLRLQLVGSLLHEDKILAVQENPNYYRPKDSNYWQEFKERVEEIYQGVVR